MNVKLKDYLSKRGATPIDTNVIESYVNTMKESTVPQIIKDIKQREQLAAESRFVPTATARRKKKGD